MEKWSKYPNFITTNQFRSDDVKISKQICHIDDAYFNIVEPRAVIQKSVKWPPNYKIRIKFLDGDDWQKAWVQKIVTENISPLIDPSLSFLFVDRRDYADVKISFKFNGYGSSMIGTKCQYASQYEPTMQYGILDSPKSRKFEFDSKIYIIPENVPETINNTGSVIKHEFGHVLGKQHEHQNPIDNPIVWNVDRTYKYYEEPPDPWSRESVYNNLFKMLKPSQVDATPFDPMSIMMYTIVPELTMNGFGFTKNDEYSKQDLEWLRNHVVGVETDYKKYMIIALAVVFTIAILYVFGRRFIAKGNRKKS